MAKGWKRESRRHSLASRGIKTAQRIPNLSNLKNNKIEKYGFEMIKNPTREISGKFSSSLIAKSKNAQITEKIHLTDNSKWYTLESRKKRLFGVEINELESPISYFSEAKKMLFTYEKNIEGKR